MNELDIFTAAMELESADNRQQLLDQRCVGNEPLRARLEQLIGSFEQASSFLESPPSALALPPTKDGGVSERAGEMIGPYKLLQKIGEGGFGVVYMAEQKEPVKRRVALKIIKLGMDTKEVVARFEAERQALALMDHPNIAKVFDAGATKTGRPYFVMELVRGVPITEFCDKRSLTSRRRLELFLSVCNAVQHAHNKGVIHRDLKPSNILVTLHDGRPVAKVIDFGVAKAINQELTEKTLFTAFGHMIGTPQYMSPEQAEMSGLDVDTRSDIYSLGALLYELLTGSPPLDSSTLKKVGLIEVRRMICEVDPPMPSSRAATLVQSDTDVARHHGEEPSAFSRILRGELDWIVMKAMDKDRTRRYETVNELAADIRRYLGHEPIQARPPSVMYQAQKFVQRHRLGVIAAILITSALLMGTLAATAGLIHASRQRDVAKRAEIRANQEAEKNRAIADFLQEVLIASDADHANGLNINLALVVVKAREVFGEDHATVAATLSALALQLKSVGNYSDAEPLMRESIRIWEDEFGSEHINVGIGLSRLGALLRLKGDDAGSELAYRRSLEITSHNSERRGTIDADSYSGLAESLLNQGRYAEAVESLEKSLAIRRRLAPHQKLELALTINLLVNAKALSGTPDEEIERGMVELLEAFQLAVPPDSPLLAKVYVQHAAFLIEHNRLDEAEVLLLQALEIYESQEGYTGMYRDVTIALLGRIVDRRDDGSTAYVAKRLEYIELVRRMASNQPQFGSLMSEYSVYLFDRKQYIEAMRLAVESMQYLDQTRGVDRDIKSSLAIVLRAGLEIASDRSRPAEEYGEALTLVQRVAERQEDQEMGDLVQGALQFRLGNPGQALELLLERPESDSTSEMTTDEMRLRNLRLGFRALVYIALDNHELAAKVQAELEAMMSGMTADDATTRILQELEEAETHGK